MTTPSTSDLSALREVAEKATPGEWFVWEGELCYRDSRGMRQRLKPSAGNAIFIAGANPQVMIKLLDHLAAEKARADAAEALAKEEGEARDHWFDLATYEVGGVPQHWKDRAEKAEATIASLTEQLAEAREGRYVEHETVFAGTYLAELLNLKETTTLYRRATLSRLEKQEGEA